MKTITTGTVPRADSSLDAELNPVELRSKEIVSWGIAFPRRHVRPLQAPMWRTDATIGTMIGAAGRMPGASVDQLARTV
jgi:hypothetical protein